MRLLHQFWNGNMRPKIPSYATLEMYNKTPIFIPLEITEDAVKLVAQKLLGSSYLGVTDSEALQGRILKFGEYIKRLRISMENFVDWLAN